MYSYRSQVSCSHAVIDTRVVSSFVGLESNFTLPCTFQERILVGFFKPVASCCIP